MFSDYLLTLIVDILAFPLEFFVDILDNLNFTYFFIGGIVIALSTRFILKPIFGGTAFSNIGGSDSVKRSSNSKNRTKTNKNRTKTG